MFTAVKFESVLMKNGSTRKPQQSRSIASLNRMFNATMELMFERQNEDFTLQEVSALGKVSIGSIYHRFKNKDELVREVLVRELQQIIGHEQAMIERLVKSSHSLDDYLPQYVKQYADILHDNALLMRMAMRHAAGDSEASTSGNQSMKQAKINSTKGLLHYRSEITGDLDTKIQTVFDVIFATLARHLNLDTKDDFQLKQDLSKLVNELSTMCIAYLKN